jgi:hypothetical protein
MHFAPFRFFELTNFIILSNIGSVCFFSDEAKAFRTFARIFLFKSELLSANMKLALHKALLRSVMTYGSRTQTASSQASRHETKDAVLLHS